MPVCSRCSDKHSLTQKVPPPVLLRLPLAPWEPQRKGVLRPGGPGEVVFQAGGTAWWFHLPVGVFWEPHLALPVSPGTPLCPHSSYVCYR